jgi:GTPase SAR1 family protein
MIGASYYSLSVKTATSNTTLNVWDIAGQERFSSVIPMYLRDSIVVVFVCLTDMHASIHVLNKWLSTARATCGDIASICVVLNKIDLSLTFDPEPVRAWADQLMFRFCITFARDHNSVVTLFQIIAELALIASQKLRQPAEQFVRQFAGYCESGALSRW